MDFKLHAYNKKIIAFLFCQDKNSASKTKKKWSKSMQYSFFLVHILT